MMSRTRTPAAAEGLPEFPGFQKAFQEFENPISRLLLLAKVQTVLHDLIFDGCEAVQVSDFQNEALCFVADEIRKAADNLDTLWLDLWNAAPDDLPPPASVRQSRVPVMGAAK